MDQLPKREACGAQTYGFLFSLGISACIAVFSPCPLYAEEDSRSDLRLIDQGCRTHTRPEAIAIDNALAKTSDIEKVEVRRCIEEVHYQIRTYGPGEQLLSTTTCCPWLGSKVTFSLLSDPKGKTDLVVANSGFEDHSVIEVFQAVSGLRIGEFLSKSTPVFLEPGGEHETVRMVFTRDIFGIGWPVAPRWPVVVNVRRGLAFDPLNDHPDVLQSSLEESRSTLERWREICTWPYMKPCALSHAAGRLEAQISALETLLSEPAAVPY